jgi:2-polyprenyl-3-methyl-5-hydroxy-6-metoxy-1,4-benzoquinol methylase
LGHIYNISWKGRIQSEVEVVKREQSSIVVGLSFERQNKRRLDYPMPIIKDPKGNEISTLKAMVDFKDLRVLEVGCGEGRLTWKYSEDAAQVTAIDPDGESIEKARANLPEKLKGKVHFLESTIEDFMKSFTEPKFDLIIFSWSL